MRLENQQSPILMHIGGLLACAVAVGMVVATGGAAFIPALLLLAVGGYYAGRTRVQAVVLSPHFYTLVIDSSRLFSASTQTFPLDGVTVRYVAQGSLRSAKYHTLNICYQGRIIAKLDPKEGYDRSGIERFHAALLASQAKDSVSAAK
jgi:hypothetical protein